MERKFSIITKELGRINIYYDMQELKEEFIRIAEEKKCSDYIVEYCFNGEASLVILNSNRECLVEAIFDSEEKMYDIQIYTEVEKIGVDDRDYTIEEYSKLNNVKVTKKSISIYGEVRDGIINRDEILEKIEKVKSDEQRIQLLNLLDEFSAELWIMEDSRLKIKVEYKTDGLDWIDIETIRSEEDTDEY